MSAYHIYWGPINKHFYTLSGTSHTQTNLRETKQCTRNHILVFQFQLRLVQMHKPRSTWKSELLGVTPHGVVVVYNNKWEFCLSKTIYIPDRSYHGLVKLVLAVWCLPWCWGQLLFWFSPKRLGLSVLQVLLFTEASIGLGTGNLQLLNLQAKLCFYPLDQTTCHILMKCNGTDILATPINLLSKEIYVQSCPPLKMTPNLQESEPPRQKLESSRTTCNSSLSLPHSQNIIEFGSPCMVRLWNWQLQHVHSVASLVTMKVHLLGDILEVSKVNLSPPLSRPVVCGPWVGNQCK